MPVFRTAAEHPAGHADRLANASVINDLAARLQARTHERIGRATHPQPFGLGVFEQPGSIRTRHGKRFFAVNMFSRVEDLAGHFGMDRRNGQVDEDFDFRVRKDLFNGQGVWDLVFCSLRLRACKVEVRARGDFEPEFAPVENVNIADVAAANDTNLDFFHGVIKEGMRSEMAAQEVGPSAAQSMPRCMISRASGTSKSEATWPSEE